MIFKHRKNMNSRKHIIATTILLTTLIAFSAVATAQSNSLSGDKEQVRDKVNEGLNLVIRGIQLVGFIIAVGQGSIASLDYQRSQGKPGKREEALDKLKVSVIGAVGVVIIPELLKILLAPYVIGWFLG